MYMYLYIWYIYIYTYIRIDCVRSKTLSKRDQTMSRHGNWRHLKIWGMDSALCTWPIRRVVLISSSFYTKQFPIGLNLRRPWAASLVCYWTAIAGVSVDVNCSVMPWSRTLAPMMIEQGYHLSLAPLKHCYTLQQAVVQKHDLLLCFNQSSTYRHFMAFSSGSEWQHQEIGIHFDKLLDCIDCQPFWSAWTGRAGDTRSLIKP